MAPPGAILKNGATSQGGANLSLNNHVWSFKYFFVGREGGAKIVPRV